VLYERFDQTSAELRVKDVVLTGSADWSFGSVISSWHFGAVLGWRIGFILIARHSSFFNGFKDLSPRHSPFALKRSG